MKKFLILVGLLLPSFSICASKEGKVYFERTDVIFCFLDKIYVDRGNNNVFLIKTLRTDKKKLYAYKKDVKKLSTKEKVEIGIPEITTSRKISLFMSKKP